MLLSKHGCSFTCPVPLKLGSQVYVLDPARGKGARARVVYRGLARAGQEATVAVEFPDTADFWNQSFLAQPH
ncbi:MAG TPA: hypothetical protein VMS96_05340 [Terriglobales bacterium]|nr:hypothetical protein [Terriglobales bacterium]